MRFLRGRNPFQFALGALAAIGAVIVVVRWIVSAVSSQTYSYAYIAGAGVAIDLPFIVVVELVTILSFVGWLVVGALHWGPRRTDG
ncbi:MULTISPECIES: hypothetical protein [unclassified Curtobacterium]|uniref:hypothetical protein n=1 Tax=unclassified Curtobacterium TaxID=257496 RepID=UPI0019684CD5|nr:hypothetical protein [Curtobacterium sp. RIT-PI-V]QSB22969.1 hypothetical protein JN350_16715 [Curtobacterium sp. 24E2]